MNRAWKAGSVFIAGAALAQGPASMKQLMLDLIHPASNQILVLINRGGPTDDREWAEVRHSALVLGVGSAAVAAGARGGVGQRGEAARGRGRGCLQSRAGEGREGACRRG